MAILGNNVKTAFLKGLEALGKTASSLTDAAQQKLSEMNLETRRREVLTEIPKCVMQLWKDGVEMPEPLTALLNELSELDEKLAVMRPAPEPKPAETEQAAEEEPAAEACECAEDECCCEEAAEPQAEEPCCAEEGCEAVEAEENQPEAEEEA